MTRNNWAQRAIGGRLLYHALLAWDLHQSKLDQQMLKLEAENHFIELAKIYLGLHKIIDEVYQFRLLYNRNEIENI
ncbi:unnamed protein product [Protopolystoma xenopodis]|uniref:Uncharacterized protein n=1 Tax=Protopolystoma xenopodis TaxID=117903 RepID=A0A448X4W4_9PLAT|nr:unnamed protein product [Protopolystoma xenopodis]